MSSLPILVSAAILVATVTHFVSATFDPATAIDCYVHTGMKHMAEKEGCEPKVVTVRGCWGRCDSFQIPSLLSQLLDVNHPMCAPASYKNVTITLPNCLPGVDSTYSYVEATTCECRRIRTARTHYAFRPDYYLP
ncbi:glycoprotein hormone beta-5-like [Diadema setosum]|uniref:glycoprotein hormone beta-5-like n=1 Tax=Diadema setosum TaxID=31175 RepID=UPI003B3B556D